MIQCGCLLGPVVGGVWVYMRLVVTVEPGIVCDTMRLSIGPCSGWGMRLVVTVEPGIVCDTMWLSIGPCSGWGLGIYETSGYSGTWDSV